MKQFEPVSHTADLKIFAYGNTFEELFCNALKGMFASVKPTSPYIIYTNDMPKITHFTSERKVVIHSIDRETLLVDFLSECLYLSDTNNEAYFDARFTLLDETELEGTIFGIKIEGFDVVEIKAVTYHDLAIEEIESGWRATLVFDI